LQHFCIAILPVAYHKFWDNNKNKAIIISILSLPTLAGLLLVAPSELGHSMIEYLQFIILLGSLYIVSGGVALTGDLKATPGVNVAFLAIGAVIANIFGTTGASMLLIRPFLKTNSERHNTFHQIPFFIFIVSNIGGLLTPNSRAYKKETRKDIKDDVEHIVPLKLEGRRNLLILIGILYGVFQPTPWREVTMIHMAIVSMWVTPKVVHRHNHYSWHPIVEVAILFIGIFITMVPALALLQQHGAAFGINEPWQYFWLTGVLSGFLDNAPTYLTFLSLVQGSGGPAEIIGIPAAVLVAISLGSVFMGANSYIGNGPNFMVKAIADRRKLKTPHFFAYMGYAIIFLLPIYIIITIMIL
jgi:Na+/H+ antiporter NhaD/arsenite permease-like protein